MPMPFRVNVTPKHFFTRCVTFTLLIAWIWLLAPRPVAAQESTLTPAAPTASLQTGIIFPPTGAAVQGTIAIIGTTAFPGLTGWDLAFSFGDNPGAAWFPLAQGIDSLVDMPLATWDTTTLTDGNYVLRLRVLLADAIQEYLVTVRVRNYSPLETATPTVIFTPTISPIATLTATATPGPTETFTPEPPPSATPLPSLTPTALPPNPASLGVTDILFNLGRGALLIFLLFGLFGALLYLRRK